MEEITPGASSPTTSNFVETHCRICGYGATITRLSDSRPATYCLLLREWITDKQGGPLITDCDRFEFREDQASQDPPSAPLPLSS